MKKYFIAGLLMLLPLAITIWIVVSIVNMLTNPFMDFVEPLLAGIQLKKKLLFFTGEQILHFVAQTIIIGFLFLFTVLLGMLMKSILVNQFAKIGRLFINKIPLINKIYKVSQDIVKPLLDPNKNSFKKVVMVPFPSSNSYTIGLLTEDSPQECCEHCNNALFSVFIPTSPNPISGYLLMYEEKDIFEINMSTEDAIKFIISCGVIYPKNESSTTKK